MSIIRYYTAEPTPKNPYRYVVEYGNVLDRHLRRLRVRKLLTSREMTEAENEWFARCWRETTYRYKDTKGLLDDEKAVFNDPEWINELTEILNQ